MSSDMINVGDLIRDGEQVLVVLKNNVGINQCLVQDSVSGEQFLLDKYAAYAMIQNDDAR
jgi:hypothetical protein